MITSDKELQAFVQRAEAADFLALDTEFMRERTYYPELCLIQAATAADLVLIDVQVALDLSVLDGLLGGRVEKILHACRQDQEVLAGRFAVRLQPIFDTQVAAALCGLPPQASYAKLVETFSGVKLAKGATRTDWSRRPLSQAQCDYAADDVRYLAPVRDALARKLENLGRTAWFDEEMRALEAQALDQDPLEAWRRVKGFAQLQGQALASLQALAAWRERHAMQTNRPRRWVISDQGLLEMAARAPKSRAELERVPDLEPALLRRQADELLQVLQQSQGGVAPLWDERVADPLLVRRLQQLLRRVAGELQLDPSVLATRSDLQALVLDQPCPRLQQGWRADVVGKALQEAL